MIDINKKLEEEIEIIVKNEISIERFNEFAIDFYLLTNKILVSLNKFLKLRSIQNPKILQIKNIGQLLYESKDSMKVMELLRSHGYDGIPLLNSQLAYYVVKKNKYTREENWENIIKVLKYKVNPSKVLDEKNKFLTEEQKLTIKNEVKEVLNLQEHELNWIINMLNNLQNIDEELHDKFKNLI